MITVDDDHMIAGGGFFKTSKIAKFQQAAGLAVWHARMAGRFSDTRVGNHKPSHIRCSRDDCDPLTPRKITVHDIQVGRALGLQIIGLTGPKGGALKPLCDVCICIPSEGTPPIQERHLPVFHVLCAMLEEEFFA